MDYVRSEILCFSNKADQVFHDSHICELLSVLNVNSTISNGFNDSHNCVLRLVSFSEYANQSLSHIRLSNPSQVAVSPLK